MWKCKQYLSIGINIIELVYMYQNNEKIRGTFNLMACVDFIKGKYSQQHLLQYLNAVNIS